MARQTQTLVVDDDTDTRVVLRALLQDEGYAVEEAADGSRALEVIQASAVPLVVLLDLDLPRLDGMQVVREVEQDARLAGRAAFIVLTALSYTRHEAAKGECAALGVPFISKPFDLDMLLDAVHEAAGRLPAA